MSSEPSEFVDDRDEQGSVFGEDEILSDFESLEGDPDTASDFSQEWMFTYKIYLTWCLYFEYFFESIENRSTY